jgi:class 3 adenylate cyclase
MGPFENLRKMITKDIIMSCLRASVVGRPRWEAQYLGQGLCRIKWLCAAGIVVWILQAVAISGSQLKLYAPSAEHLGTNAPTLVYGAVSIAIIGAFILLLSGRDTLSIARARTLVMFIAMTSIAAEALLFGLAYMAPERVASLDLTWLIVLAIMPLGFIAALAVTAFSTLVVIGAAWAAGYPELHEHVFYMIHPLSFAAIGIVASRWYIGAFKGEQLGQLRLQRHMRQVERQKLLIEEQKDEALRQRAEITKQQTVMFHALASALTAPVAHAYVSHGRFPTELKTVCVIACDAVGFSDMCRKLQPERVVFELENFFREFDAACLKCRLEPLRAQGDSRIAIAGLWPDVNRRLHQDAISAVLAMLYFKSVLPRIAGEPGGAERGRVLWPARIGICQGPASCGVIDTGGPEGSAKSAGRLWFDVWGDTVNLAARLQEAAQPNQLLVRESLLWETCGLFDHGPIRPLQVKSTTLSDATEIVGIREPFRDEHGMPNAAFWDLFNDPAAQPVRPNPAGTMTSVLGVRAAP